MWRSPRSVPSTGFSSRVRRVPDAQVHTEHRWGHAPGRSELRDRRVVRGRTSTWWAQGDTEVFGGSEVLVPDIPMFGDAHWPDPHCKSRFKKTTKSTHFLQMPSFSQGLLRRRAPCTTGWCGAWKPLVTVVGCSYQLLVYEEIRYCTLPCWPPAGPLRSWVKIWATQSGSEPLENFIAAEWWVPVQFYHPTCFYAYIYMYSILYIYVYIYIYNIYI